MTDFATSSFYGDASEQSNLTGPQGEKGDTGPQGPAGPVGPALPLPTYADNAAAIAGGLALGSLYATSAGAVRVVV
jgi:hypothetical protein